MEPTHTDAEATSETDRQRRGRSVAATDALAPTERATFRFTGPQPGFRIWSDRKARRTAAILAVPLGPAVAVWVIRSAMWLDECHGHGERSAGAGLLCYLLVFVAVLGGVLGLTLSVYLGRFARTGRIWRGSSFLATGCVASVLTWIALYVIFRTWFWV